jgi:hypothetical protein
MSQYSVRLSGQQTSLIHMRGIVSLTYRNCESRTWVHKYIYFDHPRHQDACRGSLPPVIGG